MGHKTPAYQEGAAPITSARYTHTLPGELERARGLLDKFLAERIREVQMWEGGLARDLRAKASDARCSC